MRALRATEALLCVVPPLPLMSNFLIWLTYFAVRVKINHLDNFATNSFLAKCSFCCNLLHFPLIQQQNVARGDALLPRQTFVSTSVCLPTHHFFVSTLPVSSSASSYQRDTGPSRYKTSIPLMSWNNEFRLQIKSTAFTILFGYFLLSISWNVFNLA